MVRGVNVLRWSTLAFGVIAVACGRVRVRELDADGEKILELRCPTGADACDRQAKKRCGGPYTLVHRVALPGNEQGILWKVGCGENQHPPKPPPSSPAAIQPSIANDLAMSPAEIAQAVSKSVVVVVTRDGLGTGFFISKTEVLTAFHVVRGADSIAIKTATGKALPVSAIAAFDREADLAILRVANPGLPSLTLGDSGDVEPGQPVTIVATPVGLEQTVSTGIVSAVRKLDPPLRLLQITAQISPGSSGGPVLNDSGEVLGVVRGYLPDGQGLNFATAIGSAKRLRARRSAAINLTDFAAMTAAKAAQEPSTTPPPQPLPPPPKLPGFPRSVAGFEFGLTLSQLQFACTDARNQQFARRGMSFDTQLTLSGAFAKCPDQIVPLDFTERAVLFSLSGGIVVKILVTPTSYADGLSRMVEKYSNPTATMVGSKWRAWESTTAAPRSDVYWQLDGGRVYLNAKGPFLLFVSSAADEHRNDGF